MNFGKYNKTTMYYDQPQPAASPQPHGDRQRTYEIVFTTKNNVFVTLLLN